jgi:hypothetical protein
MSPASVPGRSTGRITNRFRPKIFLFHIIVATTAVHCAPAPAEQDDHQDSAGDARVLSEETIHTEETDDVLIVDPRVSADSEGGYLVADAKESQVRRYSPSGSILWHSGRTGQGPGEYRSPVMARRLSDRNIAVIDHDGRLTLLDPSGDHVSDFNLPLIRVEGFVVIDDDQLLVSGLSPEVIDSTPLLHVVDMTDQRLTRSFFDPLDSVGDRGLARALAYAAADVLADTIVTAYSGIDSIYIYTPDGKRVHSFHLPVDDFRLAEPPSRDEFSDPIKRVEWLRSFETISGVWWLSSEKVAVSYKTLVDGGVEWHWAVVTTQGDLVHHQSNTGRLLTVDHDAHALIIVAPDSEVPDTWQSISLEP